MPLKKQMNDGLLYVEFGHGSEEDKEYERVSSVSVFIARKCVRL